MLPTHRYLAIIAPSAAVAGEVVRMRSELYATIGEFGGRQLMPHITLFIADVAKEMGGPIAAGIEAGVQEQEPFQLGYHGIVHFPDRRTIYIDPVEKEAIAHVRRAIVTAAHEQEGLGSNVRVTEHPHLTIAAGLKPHQFDLAWPLLGTQAFVADHPVQCVHLLRRALKPGAAYSMLRTFTFGRCPLP